RPRAGPAPIGPRAAPRARRRCKSTRSRATPAPTAASCRPRAATRRSPTTRSRPPSTGCSRSSDAGPPYHGRMTGPAFPAESGTLSIAGPAGALELAVDRAERPRPVVAIVCHPLPTEGGTMHNKGVTMAARARRECGVDTVRFNFRGVGASDGSFDAGDGEADDLRAVAAWVRAQRPDAALWLAGFSFR